MHPSSFTEILKKENSKTMHSRNIQLLATEIFKVKTVLSLAFINDILYRGVKNANIL